MSQKNDSFLKWAILLLALLGFLSLVTWGNYAYCTRNSGGNEFLVHWMGTRAFLKDGVSPYSDQLAALTQQEVYGRPAVAGENQLRMLDPLYSVLTYLPFSFFSDFTLARAFWMTLLEVSILLIVYLSIRITEWRASFYSFVLLFLFSLGWFHSVYAINEGSTAVLVALFIVGAVLALKDKNDEFAGVLFAFSMIKPRIVFLLVIYVIFWSINQKRWKLLGWMLGTLALLSAGLALILPDWIPQSALASLRYSRNVLPGNLGSAIAVLAPATGRRIGQIAGAVLLAAMLLEWFLSRKSGIRGFIWTAFFTLIVSFGIGIQTDPVYFIVGLPALILVFSSWEGRWHQMGTIISIVSMALLGGGLWLLFPNPASSTLLKQNLGLFFPLPIFLFISMYWVRWWAIQPPSVWLDLISSQENSLRR